MTTGAETLSFFLSGTPSNPAAFASPSPSYDFDLFESFVDFETLETTVDLETTDDSRVSLSYSSAKSL